MTTVAKVSPMPSTMPACAVKSLSVVSSLSETRPLDGSSSLRPKQVDELIQKTIKAVGDNTLEWSKRVNMMKTLRSLCADPKHHDQIISLLKDLMPPMQTAVKDLRSQVCREACVTIAYMAQQLGAKSDLFMDSMLPTLFIMPIGSAKLITIAAFETLLVIYEYVQSHRLLPYLQAQRLSKKKEIRKVMCQILKLVMKWPSQVITKASATIAIQEVMKSALQDPDPEVRKLAKECFPDFHRIFLTNSELAFNFLEAFLPKN